MEETSSEPGRFAPGASPPTSPNSTPSSPRRARFSLLTLVWLLTIAALSVGLWQTGREVLPLREEVARVRKELGYFPVDDPSKIQIRRLRGKVPNAWRWRLYLPRSRSYTLYTFHGAAPDAAAFSKAKWCELLRGQRGAHAEPIESGESSFESLLTKYGGQWWLVTGDVGETGTSVSLAPQDKWLSDETAWAVASDVSYEKVAVIGATDPVILLHVERRVHGADEEAMDDELTREQVVVWIESQ